MAELVIRKMEVEDIDEVTRVEEETFASPWPKDIFEHELTHNAHAHYFVAVLDGEVIGFSGFWAVLDDAQITNIAISPKYRGYKIGEKLFDYTCQHALKLGVTRLSLEVRESNEVAQNMYRKFGLVPGGVRKQYYTDNQEDAIVMWVNLI